MGSSANRVPCRGVVYYRWLADRVRKNGGGIGKFCRAQGLTLPLELCRAALLEKMSAARGLGL